MFSQELWRQFHWRNRLNLGEKKVLFLTIWETYFLKKIWLMYTLFIQEYYNTMALFLSIMSNLSLFSQNLTLSVTVYSFVNIKEICYNLSTEYPQWQSFMYLKCDSSKCTLQYNTWHHLGYFLKLVCGFWWYFYGYYYICFWHVILAYWGRRMCLVNQKGYYGQSWVSIPVLYPVILYAVLPMRHNVFRNSQVQ